MLPIRSKILFCLIAMVVVSIVAISLTMVRLFHDDKIRYVKDVLGMTTESVLREVDTLLEDRANGALSLAYVNASQGMSELERSRAAEALFATSRDLVAVTVLGRTGEPRIVVNGNDPLAEVFSRGAVPFDGLVARGAPADRRYPVTSLDVVDVNQTSLLRLTIPAAADDPGAGVVVAYLRPDDVRSLLEQQRMSRLQLLGADRRVMLSNGAPLDGMIAALPVVSNTQLLVSSVVVGSERYLVGEGLSSVAPFSLVVDVPRAAAMLTEASLVEQLFLLALMLGGAACIIGIWISRRLSRPLESLSAVAKEVGAGRFDVPIEVEGKDEVGALATALRSMMGGLRDRDEKLQHANAALVQSEKMAAIGQLSAGLAHEVKNPLAGILGFAQLSKRKIDDPVALRNNLDVIERETRRCSEIIGSLMQFARQERPERQPTDVNGAVQHALSIVDHQLSLKKVRIVRELAPALPVVVGNANQLEQALINLMINAQQAMQPDGGQVTVRTTYEGDKVLVSVEDTGPGVPEEIRQRIFEPFFTTKKVGQGTGLGLSVTYGLIKDHGGDITVGSGSTGGALFTIVLPAQSEPGRQVPADAATLQGSQAA